MFFHGIWSHMYTEYMLHHLEPMQCRKSYSTTLGCNIQIYKKEDNSYLPQTLYYYHSFHSETLILIFLCLILTLNINIYNYRCIFIPFSLSLKLIFNLFNTKPLSSVQFSRSVVSNSLQPNESQHARPPCRSPTPRVLSDSRRSSQWCHPAISSSVVPFSSCPQSLPASESFTVSQLFAWDGTLLEFQL